MTRDATDHPLEKAGRVLRPGSVPRTARDCLSAWGMGGGARVSSVRPQGTELAVWPVLLALLLLGCGGPQGDGEPDATTPDEPVLRFSAIPDQNTTQTREKLWPFIDHLANTLKVPVKYVASRDYQASVEMFKNSDVHLAWFGGLTGVQARQAVPGARAIAQGESDPEFYSYFIVHRDSLAAGALQPSDEFPEGLGALPFTFGSESSTSGRLMPEHFIREATGKGPGEFFEHPVGYSGSHDRTVELVESGQFQAGAVNYTVYDRRVAEGKTDPDVVQVLWKTPPYADYNWTVRPDLDDTFGEGFTERLRQTLLAIDDPELLVALPRQRLIPADNADFEGIRRVAESLDMLR